jgi:peptidoglycan/xylan/chitin deacetylase (PgdA/CDA1 family)
VAIAALALAACGAESATDDATAAPTNPDALAEVDPAIVRGITSVVDGGQQEGRLIFTTFPQVPGAEEWTEELLAEETPTIARFRALNPSADEPPYAELTINWALVGASPDALGVRLTTTEFGPDETLDGNARTSWWDPALGAVRPPRDLIDPAQASRFFTLLEEGATAAPDIDGPTFTDEIDGRLDLIDSVAFTTAGDLWIEFGPASQVPVVEPTGIAVPSDGLLSEFGTKARAAALTPSDPALAANTPTPTPTPTLSAAADESRPTPSASEPVTTTARPRASSNAAPPGRVDCAKTKCIALTFDDGPVAGTHDLLDLFSREGVRATFFPVGTNVRAHPEIIKRMQAEGHEVGNHTWSHAQLTRLPSSQIRDQIKRTSDAVEKAGGVRPTLLRPPYGATNAQVAAIAADLGVAQILWNVDPLDWRDRNAATVTKRVLADADRGDIILSHDIHSTTRAAYSQIVATLKQRGYSMVTVSELLGTTRPGKKYFSD